MTLFYSVRPVLEGLCGKNPVNLFACEVMPQTAVRGYKEASTSALDHSYVNMSPEFPS